MSMVEAKERRTTVRLPEDLHRRVKAKAALQGTTITAVIKEFLERWVEEDPPEMELKGKK